MKKALTLLLLTVFISSLSITAQHQGAYDYDYEEDYQDYGAGIPLVLTFQYAARDGLWDQDSNRFKVVFNGKVIKKFLPEDYKLHRVRLYLTGRIGKNTIHFIGQGRSDSYGAQVDNIVLVRRGAPASSNYIKNGDFESGHKLGFDDKSWFIYRTQKFLGWQYTPEMQVGWGNIYNKYWPCRTHVSELDAHSFNADIYQTFTIGKQAGGYQVKGYQVDDYKVKGYDQD